MKPDRFSSPVFTGVKLMKYGIIGTAGHVDHGKTCLIKALTGIDTDRLKEEKERGITIALGFAYLDFAGGQRAGIVDVPGHEKFVKIMLAGAGSMDLCLLVVAADEGVMPQTVEHLDILSILGIPKGLVAITKTDLVEPKALELVKEDVRKLTEGTFLENAPVLPVSVRTGQGVEELKTALEQLCTSLPDRADTEDFRLPIDRVFTMKGFGTVVTGAMVQGRLEKGEEVYLYPENLPVKVRGMQVHSRETQIAFAGQRVAVNIADRKKEEIRRGDVLAPRGSLFPTQMLDVRLEALKHTARRIKNGSRVHIYHGTKELLGKVILMDKEELCAGESGYAQLRLEEETAAKKWDRFVIRFYSPAETIGGGVILDANPGKRRRNHGQTMEAFKIKELGTQAEMLELSCREHWGSFYTLKELAQRSGLAQNEIRQNARKLLKEQKLVQLGGDLYIHREEFSFYQKKTERFLEEFHRAFPLKEGMGREEVRSRLGLGSASVTDAVLKRLAEAHVIEEGKGCFRLKHFQAEPDDDQLSMLREIEDDYLQAGFAPLTTRLYIEEHPRQKMFAGALASLLNKKVLIRLDEQYCIHRDFYGKAKKIFAEMAEEKPWVVLGEFRDSLGCSRKIAIAILEHFDKNGFSRKTENGRVLRTETGGERNAK